MILGVDYGLHNIGLAISEGEIAKPLTTLKIKDTRGGIKAIGDKVGRLGINKIVIGVSEGKSKNRALSFGKKLQTVLRLPVEYVDETFSSYEAATGKRQDKIKEHAKAAAIILQRYLDDSKTQNANVKTQN